jgi:hypothetical protein
MASAVDEIVRVERIRGDRRIGYAEDQEVAPIGPDPVPESPPVVFGQSFPEAKVEAQGPCREGSRSWNRHDLTVVSTVVV